ncbi:MAG: hypothetical protein GX665_10045 [Gammaproteobacteria bacterium]|nr:hypothetical protein [Gammaproteobacteria bacterium]
MKIPVKSGLLTVIAVTATLTGCAGDSQQALSALPPQYLQVDQFQSCLRSEQVGSYSRWCLPAVRPDSCPLDSWEQLQQLQSSERVPGCSPEQ